MVPRHGPFLQYFVDHCKPADYKCLLFAGKCHLTLPSRHSEPSECISSTVSLQSDRKDGQLWPEHALSHLYRSQGPVHTFTSNKIDNNNDHCYENVGFNSHCNLFGQSRDPRPRPSFKVKASIAIRCCTCMRAALSFCICSVLRTVQRCVVLTTGQKGAPNCSEQNPESSTVGGGEVVTTTHSVAKCWCMCEVLVIKSEDGVTNTTHCVAEGWYLQRHASDIPCAALTSQGSRYVCCCVEHNTCISPCDVLSTAGINCVCCFVSSKQSVSAGEKNSSFSTNALLPSTGETILRRDRRVNTKEVRSGETTIFKPYSNAEARSVPHKNRKRRNVDVSTQLNGEYWQLLEKNERNRRNTLRFSENKHQSSQQSSAGSVKKTMESTAVCHTRTANNDDELTQIESFVYETAVLVIDDSYSPSPIASPSPSESDNVASFSQTSESSQVPSRRRLRLVAPADSLQRLLQQTALHPEELQQTSSCQVPFVSISGGGRASRSPPRSSPLPSRSTPLSVPQFPPVLHHPPRDSRSFINGYSSDTLLIDIPINKLGTLVGLQSSITFVPDNLRKIWSRCMSKYLDRLRSDVTNATAWKKFFLLTSVICCNSSPLLRKQRIREKIKLLLDDNWESFTLGSLAPKCQYTSDFPKPIVETSQQRALKLAQVGEIGKALQTLISAAPPISATPDLFNSLLHKYPPASPCSLTPEQLLQMETFHLPDDCQPIVVDKNRLVHVIKRTPSLRKPGFDMFRFEHLRQLIGPQIPERIDPSDDLFLDRYTFFLQSIVNGEIPEEVIPLFSDHETWVIPKGDSDFRPLGGVGVHRKLASTIALQDESTQSFNKSFFKDLQFGMDRLGTEKIVHSFRTFMEKYPEKDVFAMDADNAFNRLCRQAALYEIMLHHPAIFPLLFQMYKGTSNGWFHGLEEGIQPVLTSEGVTQGDTLGSWMYCVGTMKFLTGLASLLQASDMLKCFIDDTNVGADFHTMSGVIHYVLQEGPKYGYNLKFTKGAYLMGRCGDYDEALRRKQLLVEKGLSPDIIHFHPDDVPVNSRQMAEMSFGVRMVGTYIGHPNYIKEQLREKLVDLNIEKEHIINFPDPQIKNLMFRWCFCQKIDYLQRTTSPLLLDDFVSAFDRMKREIFCSLLKDIYTADDIPPELWNRACLNIGDGGLGYRCVQDVSFCAYAASLIECSSILEKTFPGFNTIMDSIHTSSDHCGLNVLEDFKACLNFIGHHNGGIQASVEWILTLRKQDEETRTAVDDLVIDKTLQALIGKRIRLNRAEEHLRFLLQNNDHDGVAWFKSVAGSYPGRWLQHSPKSISTRLSPNEFTVMLFYRLRLMIPAIVPGSRCTGKGCGLVDPFGVHLTTGCAKGGYRHRTHDNLVLTVESLSRTCGVLTRR